MTKLHGSRPDTVIVDDLYCEPPPLDEYLFKRVKAYYDDCEAYDRTVCTGPIVRDSIRPANAKELGLINRFARTRWQQLVRETLGYTEEEIKHVKRQLARD